MNARLSTLAFLELFAFDHLPNIVAWRVAWCSRALFSFGAVLYQGRRSPLRTTMARASVSAVLLLLAYMLPSAKSLTHTEPYCDKEDHPDDCRALVELALATKVDDWVFNDKWMTRHSICDWQLVGCNKVRRCFLNLLLNPARL